MEVYIFLSNYFLKASNKIYRLTNLFNKTPAIFNKKNSYTRPLPILPSANLICPVGNKSPLGGNSNPFEQTFSTLLFSSR